LNNENIKHKARCNKLKGAIAETFIRWYKQQQGFKIAKLVNIGLNRKYNKRFCFLNKEEIERYVLSFYDVEEHNKTDLIDLFNKNINGLPDFICLKDNKISFVEVKSNNSKPTEKQERVFNILRNKGFDIEIKNLGINLEVEELI